jgi:hypothetical protein
MSISPDYFAPSSRGADFDDRRLAALSWAWSPPEIEPDSQRDDQPQDRRDCNLEPGDGEEECRERAISDPQRDQVR